MVLDEVWFHINWTKANNAKNMRITGFKTDDDAWHFLRLHSVIAE